MRSNLALVLYQSYNFYVNLHEAKFECDSQKRFYGAIQPKNKAT